MIPRNAFHLMICVTLFISKLTHHFIKLSIPVAMCFFCKLYLQVDEWGGCHRSSYHLYQTSLSTSTLAVSCCFFLKKINRHVFKRIQLKWNHAGIYLVLAHLYNQGVYFPLLMRQWQYCWYLTLVLQIPYEKVFRHPKSTPKPLAEGIGA